MKRPSSSQNFAKTSRVVVPWLGLCACLTTSLQGPDPSQPDTQAPNVTFGPTVATSPSSTIVPENDNTSNPPSPPVLPLDLVEQISVERMVTHISELGAFNSRNVYSPQSTAVQDAIVNKFQSAGVSAHKECFDLPSNWAAPSQAPCNVVAEITANQPTPLSLVLMAHFDSRADDWTDGLATTPAANDNAAGVALLIEVAHVLASSSPMHHIVFVATSAEELGSYGGENFRINSAHASPNQLRALLNFDGIGGAVLDGSLWNSAHDSYVRIFHDPVQDSQSYQLAAYAWELASGKPFFGALQNTVDRPGRWGDQLSFIEAGLPAIRFTQAIEDPTLINSPQDTVALIKGGYLVQVARYAALIAIHLSQTP